MCETVKRLKNVVQRGLARGSLFYIETGEHDRAKWGGMDGFVPNPKLKLRDQLREVIRFKHCSLRTETMYWHWIRRYILFHGKRHPREMGAVELGVRSPLD